MNALKISHSITAQKAILPVMLKIGEAYTEVLKSLEDKGYFIEPSIRVEPNCNFGYVLFISGKANWEVNNKVVNSIYAGNKVIYLEPEHDFDTKLRNGAAKLEGRVVRDYDGVSCEFSGVAVDPENIKDICELFMNYNIEALENMKNSI